MSSHSVCSNLSHIAGSLIASAATGLVFVFLQRYFIAGLTLGSSK